MAKRNRAKVDATGRNSQALGTDGAVIIIRRSVWLSPQVSALSPLARALMVELTAMYTGPTCDLFLSVRDAARRCGVNSLHAASAAIRELLDTGLVSETFPGRFAIKAGGKSKARGFNLGWKTPDGRQAGPESLPALDFGKLDATQKRRVQHRSQALSDHRKGKISVADSATVRAIGGYIGQDSVADSATLARENGGNTWGRRVADSATHISYQGGAGGVVPIRRTIPAAAQDYLRAVDAARPWGLASSDLFCRLAQIRMGRRHRGARSLPVAEGASSRAARAPVHGASLQVLSGSSPLCRQP